MIGIKQEAVKGEVRAGMVGVGHWAIFSLGNFVTGLVGFSPIYEYEIAHFLSSNFSNNHCFIQLTLYALKICLKRLTLNLTIFLIIGGKKMNIFAFYILKRAIRSILKFTRPCDEAW